MFPDKRAFSRYKISKVEIAKWLESKARKYGAFKINMFMFENKDFFDDYICYISDINECYSIIKYEGAPT